MKYLEVEKLYMALQAENVMLKHLTAPDYLKVLQLTKKVSNYINGITENINSLIKEYNKTVIDRTKTQEFKDILKKKKEGKELTSDEQEEIEVDLPVKVLQNGTMTGPSDFIDKVCQIREEDLKDIETNFLTDLKIFKAIAENATPETQIVLFEHLFKGESKKKNK